MFEARPGAYPRVEHLKGAASRKNVTDKHSSLLHRFVNDEKRIFTTTTPADPIQKLFSVHLLALFSFCKLVHFINGFVHHHKKI